MKTMTKKCYTLFLIPYTRQYCMRCFLLFFWCCVLCSLSKCITQTLFVYLCVRLDYFICDAFRIYIYTTPHNFIYEMSCVVLHEYYYGIRKCVRRHAIFENKYKVLNMHSLYIYKTKDNIHMYIESHI